MSCNYHVRQALLKTAAKKRFKNILQAREMFKLYLGEPEDDIEDYCFCGDLSENCEHGSCCEEFYFNDRYTYCAICGIEL